MEPLPGIVPRVDSVGEVDAFVALEAAETRAEHLGHHLRGLRLADAGLSLYEERFLELEREEDRRGQTPIADVSAFAQASFDLVDARRSRHPAKDYRPRAR